MTLADQERRIIRLEQELTDIKRQLTVLATGISIARWAGPFSVSIAAVIIVLLKG